MGEHHTEIHTGEGMLGPAAGRFLAVCVKLTLQDCTRAQLSHSTLPEASLLQMQHVARQLFLHAHAHTQKHIRTNTHAHAHTHTHTNTHAHTHKYTHAHTRTHTNTHTHTFTNKYTRAHTHIQTHAGWGSAQQFVAWCLCVREGQAVCQHVRRLGHQECSIRPSATPRHRPGV